jgi:large subunit ribosomal protein L24
MENIVKNDTVKVIAGNYKGKTGRVIKVIPAKNRVIVEKIQLVKRHSKPRSQQQQGGIIEKEASIHLSNVMLICPKCGKPSRTNTGTLSSGKNVRVCRACGEMITGE